MRIQLIVAALVLGLMALGGDEASAERPPRGARNCETGESMAVYPVRWFWLGERSGANYVVTGTSTQCNVGGQSRQFVRHGLNGHLNPPVQLVEDKYDAVAPYSANAALVKREDGRWINYSFRQGETGAPLPYTEVLSLFGDENCKKGVENTQVRSPAMAVALSAPGADSRRLAHVYFGDGEPTVIPGVGGAGVSTVVERHKDILIARWSDPEGAIRHRLYSLGGRPLSPVLGDVVRWATVTDPGETERARICHGTEAVDIFVVGPSLDRDANNVVWGPLLTPLGVDGAPVALPPGAIGMTPVSPWPPAAVPLHTRNGDIYPKLPQTRVWAVIYPAQDGFEFTLGEGTPAQAIAASQGAPRYVDLRRVGANREVRAGSEAEAIFYAWPSLYMRGRDGLWHSQVYFREDVRGAPAANLDAAFESLNVANQAAMQRENAAYQAEVARRNAAMLARFDARFSAGTACNFAPPWDLDVGRVARHAQQCPHLYNAADLARMRSSGLPPAAIGAVEGNRAETLAREQAYRAEQAEMARNYVPPGSWESALRAASDQQVRDIQQSTTNWLDQRRQQHNADWQRSQRAY